MNWVVKRSDLHISMTLCNENSLVQSDNTLHHTTKTAQKQDEEEIADIHPKSKPKETMIQAQSMEALPRNLQEPKKSILSSQCQTSRETGSEMFG